MDVLPYLLAGPIVRRVERDRVCIWLATSEKPDLQLELLCHNEAVEAKIVISPAFQLGRNASLWIMLLQLKPLASDGSFPADQLIHYRIFNNATDCYLDLSDVTYANEESPSFIIPSSLNAIAYGSCRKPHGFSQNDEDEFQKTDSLALLGQQLRQHLDDVSQRPSTLCLMGDQIYADDVLDPVMDIVQAQENRLFDEPIALPDVDISLSNQQIKAAAGLSSSSKNNHLLRFGEYAAMYLYVFGNRSGLVLDAKLNKTDDFPKFLQVSSKLAPRISSSLNELMGVKKERDRDYRKAEKSVQGFAESLPEVRRVLANISTYMIFDDHDVSDDWNISRLWYDNVRASKNGTRIVSNALAAYWAFQGWGNDPDKFTDAFISDIIEYLHEPESDNKAERFDFTLWKWHGWSYFIPTTPPIMVIDTRTERDFGGYKAPPKLLNRYGTDRLRGDWLRLNQHHSVESASTPIIITATPVFGYSPIEILQKVAYRIGMFFGNQTGKFTSNNLDLESWVGNKQGFSTFLNVLIRNLSLKEVIFLSGDVHYSFVHEGSYKTRNDELAYVQLTSSALRNTPKKPRFLARFLSHKINTKIKGPIDPEKMSWWGRLFLWRFSQREAWVAQVGCTNGCNSNNERIGRTSRPNIGLAYFKNGALSHVVLLSGDNREDNVSYEFD